MLSAYMGDQKMAGTYARYARLKASSPGQAFPIRGRESEMEPNNAGGFGFKLDPWERLHRFLILGSDDGTYYVGEHELTKQNAICVEQCISEDALQVLHEASEINIAGRAPKVSPQLFTLAMVLTCQNPDARREAASIAPKMLRTGSHLLELVSYIDLLGGWGPAKRRLVSDWFNAGDPNNIAFQVLKYQSRHGWSMRDVLRVAHPKASTPAHAAIFDWACGRRSHEGLPQILADYQRIMSSGWTDIEKAIAAIHAGLPREAIPTEALREPEIWRRLLPITPPHALLRNLGVATANGSIIGSEDDVISIISDSEKLRRSRVHPFAILLARLVYGGGVGIRGGKTWSPSKRVLDALDKAYERSTIVEPVSPLHVLIAIDVSGSMTHQTCAGAPFPCKTAAAAVAFQLSKSFQNSTLSFFDTEVHGSGKPPRNLQDVLRRSGVGGGGTDLSAPIRHAATELACRKHYDAIVLLTDNETWAGTHHATEVLQDYRRMSGTQTRLVCCAFAANGASVVDPKDPLQLGCAGLDSNVPGIVSGFLG